MIESRERTHGLHFLHDIGHCGRRESVAGKLLRLDIFAGSCITLRTEDIFVEWLIWRWQCSSETVVGRMVVVMSNQQKALDQSKGAHNGKLPQLGCRVSGGFQSAEKPK
jgi:hypothetical protein